MSSLIEMTCLLAFLMSTCKYNTNENVRIRDREKHHDLRYKTYLESSREYSLHRSRNVGRSRRWRKRWSDRLDTSTKVHYWSKYRFKNEFREAKLNFFISLFIGSLEASDDRLSSEIFFSRSLMLSPLSWRRGGPRGGDTSDKRHLRHELHVLQTTNIRETPLTSFSTLILSIRSTPLNLWIELHSNNCHSSTNRVVSRFQKADERWTVETSHAPASKRKFPDFSLKTKKSVKTNFGFSSRKE